MLIYINQQKKKKKKITMMKNKDWKCVVEHEVKHKLYDDCLHSDIKQYRHSMNLFKSKNHQWYTVNVNKISLSCFDNKRFILDNGCDCLAFGHYKLDEIKNRS